MSSNNEIESVTFAIPAISITVKFLLMINCLLYFFSVLFSQFDLFSLLNLQIAKIFHFQLWRLITYSFIHTQIVSLIFNMLVLWMFGSELEHRWGSKFFIKFYIITVIGAALMSIPFVFVLPNIELHGANVAIFSLLTAYAVINPDRVVYFMMIFPIKIKWMTIIIGCMSLLMVKEESVLGLTYLLHLNGIIVGFIYLKYSMFFDKVRHKFYRKNVFFRNNADNIHIFTNTADKKVDDLLDKIKKNGMESLDVDERLFLKRASHLFKSKMPEDTK